MELNFVWRDYKFFPYEKVLGQMELESLFQTSNQPTPNGIRILGANERRWRELGRKATYFSHCTSEDFSVQETDQKLIEDTANGIKRQSTRYSSHGLHEYRGKFNPQVVRAITNIMGLGKRSWVLDPFCGSGTVLVESALIGYNAAGIDINPMAVEISNAKIEACSLKPEIISRETAAFISRLDRIRKGLSYDTAFTDSTIERLAGGSLADSHPYYGYLSKWFQPSVLAQLVAVRNEIDTSTPDSFKKIFRIVLSDILRQVSLQDPGDLRIRRLKSPPVNQDVICNYIDIIRKRMSTIARGNEVSSHKGTSVQAHLGDIRSFDAHTLLPHTEEMGFDAAVTSPPYANALPYIDTQRLSIVFLEMCHHDYVRKLERELIGNREITSSERGEWSQKMGQELVHMPESIRMLCQNMAASVSDNDGFRRQNTPPLVFKYFWEMSYAYRTVYNLLKTNGQYALVVGMNKARIGDRDFLIDTPRLLADLAIQHGFKLERLVELDTYSRYDIHQSNSIKNESLILLKKVDVIEDHDYPSGPYQRHKASEGWRYTN
jgi:site-specific DNA-methyltransferase (cytosine-N4-specific)